MEEIGAADMAVAVTLSRPRPDQNPVVRCGTEEQRARWLPALVPARRSGRSR